MLLPCVDHISTADKRLYESDESDDVPSRPDNGSEVAARHRGPLYL
jgi:hypothetical protein